MAWDIERSLEQQLAIEAEERGIKEAKARQSQASLSQVAEENAGHAHRLGLSRTAFHSLTSQPDLYKKYLAILESESQ